MKNNRAYSDMIVPVFVIFLSVLFWCGSRNLREESIGFPLIMASSLFVFSFVTLIQCYYCNNKKEISSRGLLSINYPILLKCTIGLTCYSLGIIYIGYFVTTFVFMLVAMYWQKCRKWTAMILTTICTEIIIYMIFAKWLSVRFPNAILF